MTEHLRAAALVTWLGLCATPWLPAWGFWLFVAGLCALAYFSTKERI